MRRLVPITLLALSIALATFASIGATAASAATPLMFSVSHPAAFPGNDRDTDGQIRQKRAAALRVAKSVGATHIRIWAMWGALHSCNPNRARNMQLLQSAIIQAKQAGLVPMVSITGLASPDWGFACASHLPTGFNPNPQAYANFTSYVVMNTMRAPYNVRIFETYNEPDWPGFLCVMPSYIKRKDRTKAPLVITTVVKPPPVKEPTDGRPLGERHKLVGTYDLGHGRSKRLECDDSPALSAKKLRQLHTYAVKAIKANANAIHLSRSQYKIVFGNFSPKGLGYMGWALRDMRKLDADVIAVHSYWEQYGKKHVPTSCTTKSRVYFGFECLDRVRKLIHAKTRKVPSKRDIPIWITEGGLDTGEQQNAYADNVSRAMNDMKNGDGVQMVNWYDLVQSGAAWSTWISDIYGTPTATGTRLQAWARGTHKFHVPSAWLAPNPGLASCADATMPDVTIECPLAAPPPTVPPANASALYPNVTDY